MINLYMTFSQVRLFRSKQVQEDKLISLMSEFLGLPFVAEENIPPIDTLNRMFIKAKKNLVEKDLLTFQKQAYVINSKLNKYVTDRINRTGADQATQSFLFETLTVVLN